MADRIFVFMPTLTHLALVKAAIPLHNEFGMERMNRAFKRIELGNLTEIGPDSEDPELLRSHRAVKNLLRIPPGLRKRVLEAVHGLEYGIRQWKEDHSDILEVEDGECIFYWRFDGTIDRVKTARQLVQNTNIHISQRFNLACTYCLEESVQTLWAEMVTSGEAVNFIDSDNTMARFWLRWMRGGSRVPWANATRRYLNPYEGGFGPRWSCFLPLLRPEERKEFLSSLYHARKDDLRFCLCSITKEEEEQVLQNYSLDILSLFLEWPFRGLFRAAAEKLLKYLNDISFHLLINRIFSTKRTWKDFDYFELLEDFWSIVPNHLKKKLEEWDTTEFHDELISDLTFLLKKND